MRPHRTFIAAGLLTVGLNPGAWSQAPPAPPPVYPPAATARPPQMNTDMQLAERVLSARREYQVSLEELRQYYRNTGEVEKMRWAEEELREFHRLPKHAYRLDLDVPPPTLHASQNIQEANELYRRAIYYKDKWAFGSEYLDNQRRAELLFQQLLNTYPQSDKIGDAAYQLGDLYEGRAYRQYRRAAQYFERSFQWNPNTHLDGRLRAARLYDRELKERSKAMELYRHVLAHETDPKRISEAQKRLTEMSGGR